MPGNEQKGFHSSMILILVCVLFPMHIVVLTVLSSCGIKS